MWQDKKVERKKTINKKLTGRERKKPRWLKIHNLQDKKKEDNSVLHNIDWNQPGKREETEISQRSGRVGGRGRFGSGRGRGGRWKFNRINNWNKRQELKFYLHGTGPDWQTAAFTKLKEHLILKIQSEIVNGSDISESIHKGVNLYFSNEIPVKRISTEDELSSTDSEIESFKAMWNI